MSEETLKNCPFCGSEATFGIQQIGIYELNYVVCTNCACRTQSMCVKEYAIEKWNTRA